MRYLFFLTFPLLAAGSSCGGNTDCTANDMCKNTGLCTLSVNTGECIAANDKDCTYRSHACRNNGLCVAKGHKCIAATDDNCKQSNACKTLYLCKARKGVCVDPSTIRGEYGDLCLSPKDCTSPLTCINIGEGPKQHHCSKFCSSATCSGERPGNKALCLLPSTLNASVKVCIFVCQWKENSGQIKKATCPSTQTCSSSEEPSGSGIRRCVP